MKTALYIVGGILVVVGAIWILQGTNVLAGSMMSGSSYWAIMGGIAAVVGIVLEIIGSRIKKK